MTEFTQLYIEKLAPLAPTTNTTNNNNNNNTQGSQLRMQLDALEARIAGVAPSTYDEPRKEEEEEEPIGKDETVKEDVFNLEESTLTREAEIAEALAKPDGLKTYQDLGIKFKEKTVDASGRAIDPNSGRKYKTWKQVQQECGIESPIQRRNAASRRWGTGETLNEQDPGRYLDSKVGWGIGGRANQEMPPHAVNPSMQYHQVAQHQYVTPRRDTMNRGLTHEDVDYVPSSGQLNSMQASVRDTIANSQLAEAQYLKYDHTTMPSPYMGAHGNLGYGHSQVGWGTPASNHDQRLAESRLYQQKQQQEAQMMTDMQRRDAEQLAQMRRRGTTVPRHAPGYAAW